MEEYRIPVKEADAGARDAEEGIAPSSFAERMSAQEEASGDGKGARTSGTEKEKGG
jgi:hypothetical protein